MPSLKTRDRRATELKPWPAAIHDDDIRQLHSFANGVERDLDDVPNGLTPPYSSGPVGRAATRIKALKRSRYGRANLDLLRKIILTHLAVDPHRSGFTHVMALAAVIPDDPGRRQRRVA